MAARCGPLRSDEREKLWEILKMAKETLHMALGHVGTIPHGDTWEARQKIEEVIDKISTLEQLE